MNGSLYFYLRNTWVCIRYACDIWSIYSNKNMYLIGVGLGEDQQINTITTQAYKR